MWPNQPMSEDYSHLLNKFLKKNFSCMWVCKKEFRLLEGSWPSMVNNVENLCLLFHQENTKEIWWIFWNLPVVHWQTITFPFLRIPHIWSGQWNTTICQNMSYCFWMITWTKNVNNFQIAKVQSNRVLFSICLIFCQFHPGVTYKSVAYEKVV